MKYPRFSIAALAWFTAIVAIAASLPRRRSWVIVETGFPLKLTRLTREYWSLEWELLWRGGVVVGLCLIVWFLTSGRQELPP
jgi:hypothetical protein